MKKICLLSALLLLGLPAVAQESISVDEVLVPQGGKGMVEVKLQLNESHDYVSYQFKVNLPDGLSFVTDDLGVPKVELGVGQPASLFTINLHPTGHFVTCYSNPSTPIDANTGVLVRFPVQADASLAVGTELQGLLTDVAFTSIDAASHTFGNATFTFKIQAPGVYFDEEAATLPPYDDGEKGKVYMKRTIKANQWSTIVLPFTLTKTKAEAVFGADVQLAEFSGFEAVYADDEDVTPDAINIQFGTYTMTSRKGMTGGKPFLIKTSKDITEFEADDCTLVGAVTDVAKSDPNDTPGKFTGSLVKTVVPADGLFISSEKFWYSTGLTAIKAFRCWFELDAVLDKETNFEVKVFVDGLETGIESVSNGPVTRDDAVYDLGGRKLADSKADAHIRRGVYIVNGQKVVVK